LVFAKVTTTLRAEIKARADGLRDDYDLDCDGSDEE
jgi:hypothetical protein